MSLRLATLLLLGCALMPAVAQSRAEPVDDSASQVLGPQTARMHWDDLPGRGAPTVSGELSVLVRLDVAAWQGRQARIYMSLAPQPFGRVDLDWTTRGALLLPGHVRDGERALVYAGPITAPRLEDLQMLTVRTDGNRLVRPEQLQVSFEIETELP